MSRWYRAYEGTVTDPKIGEAALVAGASRSVAIATWHAILESAATAQDAGRFDTTPRRVAAALGEPLAVIEAVFAAFAEIGLTGDAVVTAWARRQYESDSSATRTRRWRDGKKQTRDGGVTSQDRSVTPPDTETDTERGEAKASLGATARENPDWPKNGFRQFYARYPRKQKPQDAEKAWLKVERIPGLTFDLVMAGVERLIASEPDAQFIPYPASWLNAGQWADVIPPKTANGGSHVREAHSVVAAARQMLAHSRQLDERERPELLQIGRH